MIKKLWGTMRKLLSFFVIFLSNITMLSANICQSQPACWQGLYLVGQLGGGWSKEEVKFTNTNYFNTLGAELLGSTFDLKPRGFLGGGGAGYLCQRGCCVFGVEAGALGLNLKNQEPSPWFPDLDTFTSRLNWLAYTKLRLGYAYNCFLPFVTVGWAGAFVDLHLYDADEDITSHSRDWANGWTIGVGCDYKMTQCISFGLAYDYADLRYHDKTIGCPSCGSGVGFGTPIVDNRIHAHIAVARIVFNL